ncbi:hypothetical protein [Chitinophaga ginsengisoli]|uniref:Uncharacterized protein n=1 Tax=Chitinophaga ginsengisoli TaxID=363837 RepID=A0A2P8FL71_9BACT|nr:hypothetical protein [Chitinophaga ginsengisoli]PSL22452.1 hypothetical protein CLV42_12278 [Chitinophaga ginsengisoli]
MERRTITVYIEGRSYQLAITVDDVAEETTYEVITSGNILRDFMPEEIDWQEDRMITTDERVKTIESEQIARIIWTDILDMMEH